MTDKTLPAPTPDQIAKAAIRQKEQAVAGRQFATVVGTLVGRTVSDHLPGVLHNLRMAAMHHDAAEKKLRQLAADMRAEQQQADAD